MIGPPNKKAAVEPRPKEILMERFVPQNVADFKAGVAINHTRWRWRTCIPDPL
jgi:hypothetical protein